MTDRLDEIRERLEASRNMISALCAPRGSPGHRDWIMSIPARPDHDPDCVLAASLRDIVYLLAEVESWQDYIHRHHIGLDADTQATEEIERLRGRVDDLKRQNSDKGYP